MLERENYWNPWVVGAVIVIGVIVALIRGCLAAG